MKNYVSGSLNFVRQDGSINKAELNALLTSLNIRNKKVIFAAVAEGRYAFQIDELILKVLDEENANLPSRTVELGEPLPVSIFGENLIENEAIADIKAIARLPYVKGVALMPDGHRVKENHAPVGSVVLTNDCILPGVVGNDIACSVMLTVGTAPISFEDSSVLKKLIWIVNQNTYFGTAYNPNPVYDDASFQALLSELDQVEANLQNQESRDLVRVLRGTARNHFGTSGDGNHFVEIGQANVRANDTKLIPSSVPMAAIMSHFGSRGVGAEVANFFIRKANELVAMPKGMEDNAPLFFGDDGWANDYLLLMNWAGEFAFQSHKYVHCKLMNAMEQADISVGDESFTIYSRHNFAWVTPDGYIHRKGATPASKNELGVIPATMGDASRIVLGLGNSASFNSASHGAGRRMSRGVALRQIQGDTHEFVKKEYGVTLIGGDKDEDPRAYKDIDSVMREQSESVQEVGQFSAVICRMAEPRFKWK